MVTEVSLFARSKTDTLRVKKKKEEEDTLTRGNPSLRWLATETRDSFHSNRQFSLSYKLHT
jgi:hypothetical protein